MKRVILCFLFLSLSCCGFLIAEESIKIPVKTRAIAEELAAFKQSEYVKKWLAMKSDFFRSTINTAHKIIAASQQKNVLHCWIDYFMLNIFPGELLEIGSEYGLFWVTEQQLPQLFAMIKRITQKMNIAMPYVFINLDKDFFNAFAYSFSTSHALMALGADLVARCSDDEIEAIIAHECGHIYYNHVPKRLAIAPLLIISFILVILITEKMLFSKLSNQGESFSSGCVEHSEECNDAQAHEQTAINGYLASRKVLEENFAARLAAQKTCSACSARHKCVGTHNKMDGFLTLGFVVSGIGIICVLAYLVTKLSRYFERQADKVAIDVVNDPQGFVDAMTLIEKDYRDRLDKYTQEYHMTLDKIAECQQVAPYWGKSLKESVDWYYNQLSGAFKKVLEGNGGDHPTPRARIEYGKEAVEVKRKNQELQTTCSA